jgi:hypothetical protein
MQIRDKVLKKWVDALEECLAVLTEPRFENRKYIAIQKARDVLAKGGIDWLCGRREISGCPHPKPDVSNNRGPTVLNKAGNP